MVPTTLTSSTLKAIASALPRYSSVALLNGARRQFISIKQTDHWADVYEEYNVDSNFN
ncbi:uncharacterized protein ASCRUDRAFT_82475 [Ascoidea rubescens DSM 1968]|uniref:Uncharacterized protein n=1 Tax=Ascoidea rubescens DSM 1968 TaxID=1344418 RepID=A0A1D2VB45_9ASCO|nr:hypothetical protein ASCRUDRAFT_82475 [Ascoidea rubescens DSM 1968]ODV58820.1 hypothetical protein ASCRUDRAFT_82475 [Ascoidea rubescens DSM 1968]